MGKKCVVLPESLAVYCCLAKKLIVYATGVPPTLFISFRKKRESSHRLFLHPEGVLFITFVYSLESV